MSTSWFDRQYNADMANTYASKIPFCLTVDDAISVIVNAPHDVEHVQFFSFSKDEKYGNALYYLLSPCVALLERQGKWPNDLNCCRGGQEYSYNLGSYKIRANTIKIISSPTS